MATAKKKPSAAQLAARAKFAAAAKAGTLRKNPIKRVARKTNPIKPASKTGYIVSFIANGERKKLGHFATKTEANRVARDYHQSTGRDIQIVSAKDFINEIRNKNPIKKPVAYKRPDFQHWVCELDEDGKTSVYAIAAFDDVDDAKKFARVYANKHKVKVGIFTKGT